MIPIEEEEKLVNFMSALLFSSSMLTHFRCGQEFLALLLLLGEY